VLDDREIRVRSLAGATDFSLYHSDEADIDIHSEMTELGSGV
jgi:hypothetical protein